MNDAAIADNASTNATRARLMSEALKLLARDGLKGVSLRQIVQAAGGNNPSALHYHFGSREQLIEAIAQMLREWLEPRSLERLQALPPDYSVRDVIEAVFGPILDMLVEPGLGPDAIRFMARLGWDFGPQGQELSARLHHDSLNLAYERLQPLMPAVPAEQLQFRLILNMNNVFHGLADRSYMRRSPFGPLQLAEPARATELTRLFFDYLEAGVRGG